MPEDRAGPDDDCRRVRALNALTVTSDVGKLIEDLASLTT
jgi:hypothetical protein